MRAQVAAVRRPISGAVAAAFGADYLLRLYCFPNRRRYALSFFGAVDLIALLPTFLSVLLSAISASVPRVTVFLGTVLTVVVIAGAAMYLVEGPEHGFTNIPEGIYWSVVTVTTVDRKVSGVAASLSRPTPPTAAVVVPG